MDTVIQKVSFPESKRILVLSDPHGHREGFSHLLSRAGFSQDDILIIVGDLLEKGPDSLGLIREVMRLNKTHTVYTLMGNVDYWRYRGLISEDESEQKDLVKFSLAARKWWGMSFLEELLTEKGVPLTEDLDTKSVFPELKKHFREELAFLENCPAILETNNMIFVHGGIPHENLEALKNEERHSFLKWDRFLSAGLSFNKTVVVGHWPVTLYSPSFPNAAPLWEKRQNILSVDGGCGVKKEGQINLLVFPSCNCKEYELLIWDGLPTVQALDAQDASADFFYIRWGDDEVSVLESNGETAKVLYHGKTINVPVKNLYQSGGVWRASETTDYRLPVSPGDTLSVIAETPNGLYAKKGSITGWYMGRYSD
ncbi:MAG: metallophosphoesterase [Clostridia bacterium]|nr:metallophosphoesterase [Clostridia bacterium]